MKNLIKTLLVICFLSSTRIIAQSIDPPASLDVIMQVATNDNTMQPGDTVFKANTNLIGKFIVVLNDTIGVNKIHIKLGTSDGASNLKNKFFMFNQQGTFNDGTSFNRQGKVLYIGLGNFTGLNTYFGEAKLEDMQGGLTTAAKFNNQN